MSPQDPLDTVSDARVLTETTRPGFDSAAAAQPPLRPGLWLLRRSPLHWVSLAMGSGLSPVAPGTVGTLWAWLAWRVLDPWLNTAGWAVVLVAGFFVGWWACTATARALRVADPSCVVWDEVLAFWLILWIVTPAGWGLQLAAFVLFRLFDAVKVGPVGWADRLFKAAPGQPPGWAQGFGILFDDLVAALCTLMVMALWLA
ncbi:phosphatidylglycerophosphatase A [Ideonella dechloratans]|uniref:Phosphatidylglycerophosphatase A n=1 Tax=Ideonella dechloratans TaxID=36863 RepID=A0A643FCK4_IDEDE|nr:phosphatidylglycerophosphatase A [Ideonella dechloratans]KAB0578183.1 phosphatidylglycerophosphatase A [Ideonella dechloratans]UFU09847.1 phosphatidylglycerophosphatase A [Ideonella dechloratans]